jgi:Stress responsive A/B Barrel Domain
MKSTLRRALFGCFLMAVFVCGMVVGQNKFGQPASVIHVVTVKWKADSTEEQRQKAIDGIKTMAGQVPGIKNIWVKKIKVQPQDYHYAFVIEFVDQAAADVYAKHPAHDKWYEIYTPIREESRSHQITN